MMETSLTHPPRPTAPTKDPAKLAVGRRIREARDNAGLTQVELGMALGITAGAVGQWEIGLASPSHKTLMKLARLLNVSADWLGGNARTDTTPVTQQEREMLSLIRRLDEADQRVIIRMIRGLVK